jgi:hypothetical protein
MVGMEYLPSESVSMPIHTEKPVVLLWNIRGVEEGVFRGTVWLHLLVIPGTGGLEERKVVSAQVIEIQVVDFWGLSGKWARALGSIGVVLSVMLLLDMFFRLWSLFPTTRSGE